MTHGPTPEERAELLALFKAESDRRIARLERGLRSATPPYRELARDAHTLRGSASVLGLPEIEEVAASLEAALAPAGSALAGVDAEEARRLVAKLGDLVAAMGTPAPKAPPHAETAREGPLVLHVEDSPANARLAALILDDVTVVSAASGEEACSLAAAQPPALVLLDLQLKDMTGEDVLGRLRERPETRDVPVIVLTGGTDQERLAALDGLGVRTILLKPYAADELRRVVRDTLAAV